MDRRTAAGSADMRGIYHARTRPGRRLGYLSRMRLRAALLLGLLAAAPAAAGDPDATAKALIAGLRPRAAAIRVDGDPRDWSGFHRVADREAVAVGDRSLDIEAVALAPLDAEVLVLVTTAGAPSRQPRAFSLDVDFLGRSARDAVLRFGADGAVEVTAVPESGDNAVLQGVKVEVRFGEAIEVRLPLSPVAAALGGPGREWLRGERRSFVRVQPWSWRTKGGTEESADAGPAVASFRLTDPAPVLDPPPPPAGAPRRLVLMPLAGRWFVRQGADGLWSHRGLNAYDLSVVDHTLRSTAAPGSRRLEDYYAYGRPVFAPEAGSVVFDSLQREDGAPLEATAGRDSGNTLVVRLADGFRLSFAHLRHGSLAVDRAAAFRLGDLLAEVGNSGDSRAPHLHLSLHDRPGEFVGLPLGFRRVRVGLNPGDDDPWARTLPEWALREGWFVEREQDPYVPAAPPFPGREAR